MNTSSVLSSSLCRMDTTVSIQQQQQHQHQQQQVVVLPPSCLSRLVGSTATTTTTTTTTPTTTGNPMFLTLVQLGYSLLLSVMALIIVVFGAWMVMRFYYWYTSPLHNLPGEKKRRSIASFWCGVLPQICREGFMQAEQRWWKEAGPDVKLIHQPHWLGSSYVLVLDKDIVRTILTAPEGKRGLAPRFRTPRDTFRVFIGKGLLTLEGDEWRRHRRIIEPSFNGKLLEETLSASVPPIINQMVQLWGDAIAADPGREIDVNSHFSASTLDVLGNVTLSHDFGGIQAIRDWATSSANGSSSAQLGTLTDKFVTAVVDVVRFSIIGALCFVLEPPSYIQDCLIRMSTRLRQGRNKFKQEAENIVRNAKKKIALEAQAQAQAESECAASAAQPTTTTTTSTIQSSSRANCNNNGDGREEDPNDDSSGSGRNSTSRSRSNNHNNNNNNTRSILQLMLKAQQKDDDSDNSDNNNNNNRGGNGQRTLNHVEIRDEVVLFFMAGHETTAAWLYWCMFALATYPDVQEKVYQDVMAHTVPANKMEIGIEETSKMQYLNGFLQEVLRLYSPVPRISRVTTQTETLAGQVIPKGTRLLIYSYLLHRSPLYWDEPDSFLPERWINVSKEEADRRRFAFLPFSNGSRSCIGQRFANLEAQMMVAAIVRAFRVQVAPSQRDCKFSFISLVTVKTNPELKIVVQKRR